MHQFEETIDQRAILEERFRSEVSWNNGTLEGVPEWIGTLLTDLVLAVGDDDICYFSSKYVPATNESAGSMAVIIFTDILVAYAALDLDPGAASPQFEVTVTARKELRSFSIETDPGIDASTGSADGMRISVVYPDFSRTLPLGLSKWPGRDTDTASLIRNLRFDLAK